MENSRDTTSGPPDPHSLETPYEAPGSGPGWIRTSDTQNDDSGLGEPRGANESVGDGGSQSPEPVVLYRCVVADPPWAYDIAFDSHRATPKYGVMSLDDIKALPVSDWVDPAGAHLYLWTTNAFMVEGHAVCRAWGFEPKTIVTWVKPQLGVGNYFRNTTEHAIFATRGKLAVLRRDMPTHFIGRRRAHSQKPDGFLWIAEQMSPGPRLEMFARQRRDGWDVWGNQAPEDAQMVVGL